MIDDNLLPQNKTDFERVAMLKELDEEQLNPLIPNLLVWLQDGNWPIASEISQLLLKCGYALVPHIKMVLESDDAQWKFFVLQELVRKLDKEVLIELAPELLKLAMNPTEQDQYEEIDEIAEQILSTIL